MAGNNSDTRQSCMEIRISFKDAPWLNDAVKSTTIVKVEDEYITLEDIIFENIDYNGIILVYVAIDYGDDSKYKVFLGSTKVESSDSDTLIFKDTRLHIVPDDLRNQILETEALAGAESLLRDTIVME